MQSRHSTGLPPDMHHASLQTKSSHQPGQPVSAIGFDHAGTATAAGPRPAVLGLDSAQFLSSAPSFPALQGEGTSPFMHQREPSHFHEWHHAGQAAHAMVTPSSSTIKAGIVGKCRGVRLAQGLAYASEGISPTSRLVAVISDTVNRTGIQLYICENWSDGLF